MFAFLLSLAEPLWLLFFGVFFLATATVAQMRLTKKQRAVGEEIELLGSETNQLSTRLQSQ
jgi:hypothetical protein